MALRRSPAASAAAVEPLLRLLVIAVISGAMWLIGLGPWLLAALKDKPADSGSAQHYLPAAGAQLEFPMLRFTLLGALCMLGALWLVWRARSSTRAGALTVAVLAVYAWSLLSMLTTLARHDPVVVPAAAAADGAAGGGGCVRLHRSHPGDRAPVRAGNSQARRRRRRDAGHHRGADVQPGHSGRAAVRHRRRLHRHRRQRPAGRPPSAGRRALLPRDRRQDPAR